MCVEKAQTRYLCCPGLPSSVLLNFDPLFFKFGVLLDGEISIQGPIDDD